MGTTDQMIKDILAELEKEEVSFTSGKDAGEKTIEQVAEKLLGRKMEKMSETVASECPQQFSLEIEKMVFSRNRNNHIYEVKFYQPLDSAKTILGRIKKFIKRVIRKLMAPIMNTVILEQNKFNASVTTSINLLTDNEVEIAAFMKQQELYNQEIKDLRNEVLNLRKEIVEERLEVIRTRKRLHREVKLLEEQMSAGNKSNVYEQLDYARFENYFRGSQEDTQNAQKVYVPYFRGKKKVLDLGCGRGEFLELLKASNTNAVGIEMYEPFVKMCQEKRLEVYKKDAVEYVHELDDESVDGIFAAQLIEHLDTGKLVQLCQDAYYKLTKEGVLILETPNPTCLSVFTNSFYMDPSHTKPVHPKTLEYILKDAGFENLELIFTEGSKVGYRLPLLDISEATNLSEFNDGINCLSDLIYGSQDYAVIARK